ncbi:MAG TPA: cupin domain-containing protein [Bryobacteraceae bacterium]|jgi:mannose-6-phosphate isomerase-like protein (cupin superfamily)|nr:cupin domain-containing protein [Bryobacteraceae bacterium]
MKKIGIGLTLLLAAAAIAQRPAGPPNLYSSAADIQALIAKAKAARTNNQPTVTENILRLPGYQASLEYRASVGPAAVHDKEAEFFYVIDGSATMITGGKLTEEKRNGDNLTGTGIEDGTPRSVAKGDFIVVPEKTAHWFSKINQTLVLMSLHVPSPR